MTTREVQSQIIAFVVNEILIGDDTPIDPDDELLVDGVIDSLGVTRVMGFVSREYGIQVPPQDITIENFGTIAALASYVVRSSQDTS